MATIKVGLGKRSYDIRIQAGLLDSLHKELAARQLEGPAFVITSPRIRRLHGGPVLRALQNRPESVRFIQVPEGENSKSLEMASRIFAQLIQAGADRSAVVLALGGGVIGDLAGFVAATYLRGVRLVQIPTTLLAQIDSSIGGKVGVNHPLGKNLIGAFFQPSLVVADPEALKTLPVPEWRSGLMEAIKYGVIADRRLFAFMESYLDRLRMRDMSATAELIESCAAIKARVVSRDERESRLRMILNFGHTVGHALEVVTDYEILKHGEAVGWGMLFAVEHAQRLGLLHRRAAQRVKNLVAAVSLPALPALRTRDILAAMQQDKKRAGDLLRLVLPVSIGKVMIYETNDRQALAESLKACGIVA